LLAFDASGPLQTIILFAGVEQAPVSSENIIAVAKWLILGYLFSAQII
jgi:hypothetical protein